MKNYEKNTAAIKHQEKVISTQLLTTNNSIADILQSNEFAKTAYYRVTDMFEKKDFERCKRLIMVGCGPFPMTILHILEKYPDISICALDIDIDILDTAEKLINKLGLNKKITFCLSNGINYDYSDAEIIYIANLVRPKSKVLRKIYNTCKEKALVILRDPTHSGKNQAEVGLNAINGKFSIESMGKDDSNFNSRHAFLRRI